MLVSSTAPLPQNSLDPPTPQQSARYYNCRGRVFQEVLIAASRYNCYGYPPPTAFAPFGVNLQYQVQRAANLVNKLADQLTPSTAQSKVTSIGTSGAPKVTALNPVNTNPVQKQKVTQPGPFDTPGWGDMDLQWPAGCTPFVSLLSGLQNHPWWVVGGLAAVALATGTLGGAVKRRRRAA